MGLSSSRVKNSWKIEIDYPLILTILTSPGNPVWLLFVQDKWVPSLHLSVPTEERHDALLEAHIYFRLLLPL